MCKPCMPDCIVLSDEEKQLDTWNLAEGDAQIFAPREAHPPVGARVVVTARVHDGKAPNGGPVHYRLAEDPTTAVIQRETRPKP